MIEGTANVLFPTWVTASVGFTLMWALVIALDSLWRGLFQQNSPYWERQLHGQLNFWGFTICMAWLALMTHLHF